MLRRRLLAAADIVAAIVGTAVVAQSVELTEVAAPIIAPLWIVLAKLHGLYDRDHRALRHLTTDEAPILLVWSLAGTAATMMLLAPLTARPASLSTMIAAWLVASGSALALRSFARWVWRRRSPRERTLILGEGPLADATRRKLELFTDIHVTVLNGRLDLGIVPSRETIPDGVDRIIVASPELDEQLIATLVARCRAARVKLTVVPPARGAFGTAVQLKHVADLPVIEYNTWDVSRSTLLLKRLLDVVVSLIALVVLSPVFVVIAVAVKLGSPGPVMFTQLRAGEDGRPFLMLKFRTMLSNAEELLPGLVCLDRLQQPSFKLAGDPRVTPVGRFLRRASLDELPQLLNVLKGEMSLVGPRPEQLEVVERYAPVQRLRLAVKPGLTGPMQVFGRGELEFEERLAVEREYIENLSLGRDLRLLALTIRAVVTGAGAF